MALIGEMIGEVIGNYRLAQVIGGGSFGEVYRAEHKEGRTTAAVKVLKKGTDARGFFDEAKIVNEIQHAGTCHIWDYGITTTRSGTDRSYLVMELLIGESLKTRLERGRMSAPQIVDVCSQIASVLRSTHEVGVVHRDLKPDNLFLVRDGDLGDRERVKVLDFGIAKLTGNLADPTNPSLEGAGTPYYMAPEIWTGSSDWPVDVYALGCIAFEMACLRPPFLAATNEELCHLHLHQPAPSARTFVPDLPPAVDSLISRLLAKRPQARCVSMTALELELVALGGGRAALNPLGGTQQGVQANPPIVRAAPAGGTLRYELAVVPPKQGAVIASPQPGVAVDANPQVDAFAKTAVAEPRFARGSQDEHVADAPRGIRAYLTRAIEARALDITADQAAPSELLEAYEALIGSQYAIQAFGMDVSAMIANGHLDDDTRKALSKRAGVLLADWLRSLARSTKERLRRQREGYRHRVPLPPYLPATVDLPKPHASVATPSIESEQPTNRDEPSTELTRRKTKKPKADKIEDEPEPTPPVVATTPTRDPAAPGPSAAEVMRVIEQEKRRMRSPDADRGYGSGLISEKSLDEVILAYLSESSDD